MELDHLQYMLTAKLDIFCVNLNNLFPIKQQNESYDIYLMYDKQNDIRNYHIFHEHHYVLSEQILFCAQAIDLLENKILAYFQYAYARHQA